MRESFAWMEQQLESWKMQARYRQLQPVSVSAPGWLERDGKVLLNLASNDYLGLGQESGGEPAPGPEERRWGAGASRLIVGTSPVHAKFEREFAVYKGTESALIFGSGFMANAGVIPALVGRGDVVFSDRLNHASIVDGIVSSRAEHRRYRHKDMDHLEKLLKKHDASQKKLIVTDAVFSMDGDLAPLAELVELKERYGAMLMIDEAHSSGVFGREGRGLADEKGLTQRIDVHMGTFSKAYGCYGAYVAGDRILIDYLINTARSFIFTTALPPALIAAIHAHWTKLRTESWRREQLHARARRFRDRLKAAGLDTGPSETQIVPVMVGDNQAALDIGQSLQADGIAAVAIRPPTVPEGEARIRFSLMAVHTQKQLDEAAERIIRTVQSKGSNG